MDKMLILKTLRQLTTYPILHKALLKIPLDCSEALTCPTQTDRPGIYSPREYLTGMKQKYWLMTDEAKIFNNEQNLLSVIF